MRLFRQKRVDRVALVAAVAFLLQALLSAWAAGSMAAVSLDAFGNPLNVTSGGAESKTPPSGGHADVPACCTLGCGTLLPVLSPPDASSPALTRRESGAASLAVAHSLPGARLRKHDPGSPRAPPLIG